MHTSIRTVSVEAEAVTSVATLSRRRVWWKEPFDEVGCRSDHHLQLSLLPQGLNSRVCFPEHWGPRRFERVGNVFLFPANQVLHAKSDCSIGTYISESRIERARRLLVGGHSIKAISISLGFSSPANFSTTFRRVTGESPREFRSRVERV
jgi:AraC-like DNA-binding protein